LRDALEHAGLFDDEDNDTGELLAVSGPRVQTS
jgi:hypothetical protein